MDVLLLNQKNYKTKWINNFELKDTDEIICKVKPRYYFDKEVNFVLRNNNNSDIFETEPSKWNNKNFLKSHLQKCIRRHKKKLSINSSLDGCPDT